MNMSAKCVKKGCSRFGPETSTAILYVNQGFRQLENYSEESNGQTDRHNFDEAQGRQEEDNEN
jgi:hypothetical protein